MISQIALSELKKIVGDQNFSTAEEDKIVYSYDATPILSKKPEAILFPQTTEQISQIVKLANKEKFPIIPRGSGTGLSGGSIPVENGVVLVMTRWNKIIETDLDNLTMLVEPGVITEKIDEIAASYGLFYPPDPGSAKISTIGGNVAENAGGLRGLKYGVTKNYILGIELVTPAGDIIFTGGKNVKDVAGYNLRDILIGSEGTLGIFTKILVKLIPRPTVFRTLLAFFESNEKCGDAISEIIAARITPAMMEFLDNTTIRCVEDYTHIGLNTNLDSLLIIELDGWISQIEHEIEVVKEICKKNGALEIHLAKNESDSNRLKAARRSAFSSLARVKPTTILEDATVPRSHLGKMLGDIQKISRENDILIGNFGHAGDGNLHPTILTNENNKDEIYRAEKAFDKIFNTAINYGGTISGEHGTGLSKRKFLEISVGRAGLDLMKKIKSVWDPNNVINPEKIFLSKPKCEGRLPNTKEEIKNFEM